MNFKKYNIMFIFLLAMIIVIPIVTLSARSTSVDTTAAFSELPTVAEVDTSDGAGTASANSPVKFSNAWQAYNYIKNSTLSKSYSTKTIQNVTASADVGVTKLEFKQKVVLNAYKTIDGKIYEEAITSGTKNFFTSTYYDGTDVYSQKYNGAVSADNKPKCGNTKNTKDEYLKEHGVMPAYNFDFNKSNSATSAFAKSGTVYSFRITITNSNLWSEYLKQVNYMSESETYPSINSIYFDFEVSSKTGKLLRLTMYESYNIKYAGVNVTCSSVSCKAFYEVGANVQMPDMSFMGL